jgi:glycosyltransferase involved in cell wall biosynthesis
MTRPTLALCCILKNEAKHLPRFLENVRGCFDEIHLTDTGSTDGSLELIQLYQKEGLGEDSPKLQLHHFEWVDDFAAARNYSFSHTKADYIMWLDLDDAISDPKAFQGWRDTLLPIADFWMASYHYALGKNGKPLCSFARERVVKNHLGFQWKYFVHEGLLPESPVKKHVEVQYALTWAVNHLRDEEDLKSDRSRNLRLFEKQVKLNPRMRYYYGKELFENGKPLEAFGHLKSAVTSEDLELHDRIMGFQYASLSAMHLGQFELAIQMCHQGLQLAPQRAEFFVAIADSYIKLNRPQDSLPFYEAATKCPFNGAGLVQGPIFSHEDAYRHYPLNQLARVHHAMGNIEKAEKSVNEAMTHGPNPESDGIKKELEALKKKVIPLPGRERKKTEAIVISCPPGQLYEWDEEIYRQKGIGGSETAVVEMAHWMAKLANRDVLIFNPRTTSKSFGRVHYLPSSDLPQYFNEFSPEVHIAWRHLTQLSKDPIYLWCHDLGTPGITQHSLFHRVFALSQFHRGFLKNMYGVPDDKIIVTGNGVDPNRFSFAPKPKVPGRIIFSSSPDRGLDRAIEVLDLARASHPEIELHVFYGFENMLKMGRQKEVADLKAMMEERPWVVFRGNVSQKELTEEMEKACVWLYPTNFLETYCITAIEALCTHTYPIVRRWGALPDTLGHAAASGSAMILDNPCETPEDKWAWAKAVTAALEAKPWERMATNPQDFAWQNRAIEWLSLFGLWSVDGNTSMGLHV